MMKIKASQQESEKTASSLARSLFHCFKTFKRFVCFACFHWLGIRMQACNSAWLLRLLTSAVNISGRSRSYCIMLRMLCLLLQPVLLIAQLIVVSGSAMKAQVEFGGNWMRKRRCHWIILSAKADTVRVLWVKQSYLGGLLSRSQTLRTYFQSMREHRPSAQIQLQYAVRGI